MIRGLIKLAVYGLVGYAAYHFFTDVSSMIEERANEQQSRGRKRGGRGGGARSGGQQMTGRAKQGKAEETAESDGGSVRHRVGRGVV